MSVTTTRSNRSTNIMIFKPNTLADRKLGKTISAYWNYLPIHMKSCQIRVHSKQEYIQKKLKTTLLNIPK